MLNFFHGAGVWFWKKMEVFYGKKDCSKSQQEHCWPSNKGGAKTEGLAHLCYISHLWNISYIYFLSLMIFFLQEEEHRMRKVAANISKDVKKFWIKIEKLASSFILFNIIDYCKTCIRIFLVRRNLAILVWFEESRLSISINWSLRRGRKRPLINSLISF